MPRLSKQTVKKKQDAVVASLANGATLTAACKAAGISRVSVWKWVNADPDFAAVIRDSKDAATKVVYDAMFIKAVGRKYAECKVTLDDVYENGLPKKGPNRRPLVRRTRSRVNKEVEPNVAAADLWLRNHDRANYIQRQPEVAVGVDMDALKRTLNENVSAYPETEGKEGKEQ